MQKKFIFLVLTGLLCLSLAGCGQSGGTPPEEDSSAQTEQPAELPAEEPAEELPETDPAGGEEAAPGAGDSAEDPAPDDGFVIVN